MSLLVLLGAPRRRAQKAPDVAEGIHVQRCKKRHIERRELGIRIELETQDDLGHYECGFDVFPRRKARTK